eukprot:TRINITY_DN8888_c0_g1_i1.p1 TRINITY_DN8888_c0_g1~~TRINITY_DN8888_c0_g1_i1.p1  ORF type:complete len:504 (+),score=141.90 TRINITY_DN8888_c0_g1_i1:29-1513(+)
MAVLDLSPFNTILARLESVADRLEQGASLAPSGQSGGYAGTPASSTADCELALAFDKFREDRLPALENIAKDANNEDFTNATKYWADNLKLLRDLFAASGKCQKPKDEDWNSILKPWIDLEKAASRKLKTNELRKAMEAALPVIKLILFPPPQHVQNTLEEFDFHAIKVMQKKVEKETEWIKKLKELLKDLKEWCTENCKLGVTWKADGQAAKDFFEACPLGSDAPAPAAAAPGGGKAAGKGKKGPPMPKGGLHGPTEEDKRRRDGAQTGPPAPAKAGGMAAVFSAINEGGHALKKVTDADKTKNQKDRPVLQPKAKAQAPVATGGGHSRKGPRGEPKKVLEKDTNWELHNYDGATLVMDDVDMKQLVLILNCRNTTVTIKNKVKSVCIDSCDKVNVVVEDVLSAVELVNSDRCKLWTTGKVNSVSIDKCDGVNVFLSKESIEADIYASKSSEMNVTIPDPADPEETIELPIPEQFVTKVVGKSLKTEVSGIYS